MLTIPEFKPRLNLVVSQDGKIISDENIEAHSFVRNWYTQIAQQACFVNARTANNFGIVDTTNTSRTSNTECQGYSGTATTHYIAGAGVTTFGLLVGNSDTAWAFTQYAMSGLIAHGNGSGQLGYTAQSTTVKSDTDDTRTTTLTRVFNNNSGGDVTVREIGWAKTGWTNSYTYNFMLFREVLAVPVVLANTQQLTVNFAIDIVYPETIS